MYVLEPLISSAQNLPDIIDIIGVPFVEVCVYSSAADLFCIFPLDS